MTVDKRLAKKGRPVPSRVVAQEGQVHVALAQQHGQRLADHGWSPGDTQSLASNVNQILLDLGSKSGAKDGAAKATRDESAAIDQAKAYIGQLRLAAPRAIREMPDTGVTMRSFQSSKQLLRSTPAIIAYLAAIRPAVVLLDPALAKSFKGTKGSVLLDQVLAALTQADATQELARKNRPAHTSLLLETTGRVLEQIEDLNRAGKLAFYDDPTTAAQFNKAVLARASSAKKKAASPKTSAPPPAAGATAQPAANAPLPAAPAPGGGDPTPTPG